METYRILIHLNSGQTLAATQEFPADLDDDEVVRLVEHQVAMARAELASRDRIAGVHQNGPPPAPGQWPAGPG